MTTLELVVTALDDSVPGIRSMTLAAADGSEALPTYVPGSHLVVECGGRANAYSLTGDAVRPATYSISVLRLDGGAGGSRWIHDELSVGDLVEARLPRSAFAPANKATRHVLVAGGIGVTPILSHVRAADQWGRDMQVLYAHREGHAAHVEELRELAGDRLELFTDQAEFVARLAEVLVAQRLGTHLYVCGPAAMIDHVLASAADLGWPPSRLHAERFGIDVLDPGEPFTVTLSASGTTIEVPSGTSLLEALLDAGHDIPNLCRQGVCGECRIPVVGGKPLHRDLFLSDGEKEAADALMCCVSRAEGPGLEVAL
ncbi:PDR/VanB family oxidoreductase [Aeromicrobium sp.]|uniref:PDR/VanB family oxidoreductase n=1 Tax=Aeromicrobium sp. TaxID=1871063 RepID=UPI002FCB47B3